MEIIGNKGTLYSIPAIQQATDGRTTFFCRIITKNIRAIIRVLSTLSIAIIVNCGGGSQFVGGQPLHEIMQRGELLRRFSRLKLLFVIAEKKNI